MAEDELLESERRLVVKALQDGISNCVAWKDDRVRNRIAGDRFLKGLTPEFIRNQAIESARSGAPVVGRKEDRPNWRDKRDYWFKICFDIEIDGCREELFVEMELRDDDEDFPIVDLVNAHF